MSVFLALNKLYINICKNLTEGAREELLVCMACVVAPFPGDFCIYYVKDVFIYETDPFIMLLVALLMFKFCEDATCK